MKSVLLISVLFSVSTSFADLVPVEIPAAVLKKHQAITGEDCAENLLGAELIDLGKKGQIYIIPCTMAAYQGSARVYLSEYENTMISQITVLDYSEAAKGVVGTLDLTGVSYDRDSQSILTFSRGRGVGDCGSSTVSKIITGEYGGVSVKTTEIRAKMDCDGKMNDWPVVFKQP